MHFVELTIRQADRLNVLLPFAQRRKGNLFKASVPGLSARNDKRQQKGLNPWAFSLGFSPFFDCVASREGAEEVNVLEKR
ncbi:hypothetical protein [Paenibacillus sp. MMO-177]|uniref:hypothetical protein n=1 Tax=Paenibacillus sp. MMO-177 TaxID=3081289 RepID=UPI00301AE895